MSAESSVNDVQSSTSRTSESRSEGRRARARVGTRYTAPVIRPRYALALTLCLAACSSPGGSTPADGSADAKIDAKADAKVDTKIDATVDATVDAPEADNAGEWRAGTVTTLPNGSFAIHADDDSVTVCAGELPPALARKDAAVLFRGDVDTTSSARLKCRPAKQLEVKAKD